MHIESMEAPGNVGLMETAGFVQRDDVSPLWPQIYFQAVLPLLSQTHPSDTGLRDILSSSQSHFFTAVLFLTSSRELYRSSLSDILIEHWCRSSDTT